MIPVHFHPEARIELIESARYYESQRNRLGHMFLVAVRRTIDSLQSFPLLYREIGEGVRQCRVAQFPYGLIYRPLNDQVEIVAVLHLHRKPGYWKNRISIKNK